MRRPRTLRDYWWLSDYFSNKKNDIAALWSCSGKAGASLLGQDVVASLLSLCMAKWLLKWRRGWLYVRSNTKNAKSLLSLLIQQASPFTILTPCERFTCKASTVGVWLSNGLAYWVKWFRLKFQIYTITPYVEGAYISCTSVDGGLGHILLSLEFSRDCP